MGVCTCRLRQHAPFAKFILLILITLSMIKTVLGVYELYEYDGDELSLEGEIGPLFRSGVESEVDQNDPEGCTAHCDFYRPKNTTSGYILNCAKILTTDENEKIECGLHCLRCPKIIKCTNQNLPPELQQYYCPPKGKFLPEYSHDVSESILFWTAIAIATIIIVCTVIPLSIYCIRHTCCKDKRKTAPMESVDKVDKNLNSERTIRTLVDKSDKFKEWDFDFSQI